MTDVTTMASTSMSKLKKPTPIKSSGIPKFVSSIPSPSPVSNQSQTPTKPSRLPVSRPLSRSISSSPSPTSHNDATNPPNTPVTPASARTPIKRVATSVGRPVTPTTGSRIPGTKPQTTPTTNQLTSKPAFRISSKAAEITSRLSTPGHSRTQSVSVDHMDPTVNRSTTSRLPVSKLVRPSTAGASRIGMGRPASQSIASSTASSVAGTAHSSPKQEKRSINPPTNQRAKPLPPDVLDLDAILASAEAAQQAVQEVNEQERELSTNQPLSPHLHKLHQRKKSERLIVDQSINQFEPNSPGLLDLDDFGTFDDSEFDTPARPVQPIQQAVAQPIAQPQFDDEDGLLEDQHTDQQADQLAESNDYAQEVQVDQDAGLLDDEDIHFDDSNDNNLVETPYKPEQESKEAEDQFVDQTDDQSTSESSFFISPYVAQPSRAIVNSVSADFDEKEQTNDSYKSKYAVEEQFIEPEVTNHSIVEPIVEAEPVVEEPIVEPVIEVEPVVEAPVVEPEVVEQPTAAEEKPTTEEPVNQPTAKSTDGLLDDDLSAFDNDEPLEFDDDFFEPSPRTNQSVNPAVAEPVQNEEYVAPSMIVVESCGADVDHLHLPSSTPPTRTPNVTIVEQPANLRVEQSSEPWALMDRTDDNKEICFEDEHQHFDESEAGQSVVPMITVDKVSSLMPEADDVVTRTPAPSTVALHAPTYATRTPAPSTVDAPVESPSVIIESVEGPSHSSLAPFDVMHNDPVNEFDLSIETRAPASTAWQVPQPTAVAQPTNQSIKDEAINTDGLDLSFDDNMSLPVSPVHFALVDQPEVKAFNQSVSSVHEYAVSEADANKAAALKLREMEEARRAELDRQLANQAAVAAASLKQRQEAERAEAARIAAEQAEIERLEAEQRERFEAEEREQQEFERAEAERAEAERAEAEALQNQTEYEDQSVLSEMINEVMIDSELVEKWSEGCSITKLGRNGKTRATSIFLNESSSHPVGIAWASKSKKPVDARMVLKECRCVIGAEDGLFVHRKFTSKFAGNSGMCVSLIAPSRSLDFIFNSEADLESFITLMKAYNVRIQNRVPNSP